MKIMESEKRGNHLSLKMELFMKENGLVMQEMDMEFKDGIFYIYL